MADHPKYKHPGDENRVTIDAHLVGETTLAFKCEIMPPGRKDVKTIYLPKSICDWAGKDKWDVPHWFALKEGLI